MLKVLSSKRMTNSEQHVTELKNIITHEKPK